MPPKRRTGPLEGHWMSELKLIKVQDDSVSFLCCICVDEGVDQSKAVFRCGSSASNVYAHFKNKHSSIYQVLQPIVKSRELNKKPKTQHTTISELTARSRQKHIDNAFLCLFASPDISKCLIEHPRFRNLLRSISPHVNIPTAKTLSSRLWEKFYQTLSFIQEQAAMSELVVLTFDGWSTYHNDAVIGFMISFLNHSLILTTLCVGNLTLRGGHGATDVSKSIETIVTKRLGGRVPDYFVSDSAPVNKAAVRAYMKDVDDEHWYPCAVHFCQLAMRESVSIYLNTPNDIPSTDNIIEWDEISTEQVMSVVNNSETRSKMHRLITICRAIHNSLKRSHAYNELFEKSQAKFGVSRRVSMDVKTRFDSTVLMFESILNNQHVLNFMQGEGAKNDKTWPPCFHLSPDDWVHLENIVSILKPVREATLLLSSTAAHVGDVLPVFTSVIDKVQELSVTSQAEKLQKALVQSVASRVQMLLGVEQALPFLGGSMFDSIVPNEYVVSSILNPRFSFAISACYGYSDRRIILELVRIYAEKLGNELLTVEESQNNATLSEQDGSLVDEWALQFSCAPQIESRNSSMRSILRSEFIAYRKEIQGHSYSSNQSREFWLSKKRVGKYVHLGRIARLFLSVPASAIPQERHFSELKRRSAGLRNRTKIDTLDRDAVVFSWWDQEK